MPVVYYSIEGKILHDSNADNLCSSWSGLSCVHTYNTTSPDATVIDSQLHVTWDASTVLAPQTGIYTKSTSALNGDHHFSCHTKTDYLHSLNITVRGE